MEKHSSPRSYIISTETEQTLRRNRKHLLKTKEKPISIVDEEDELAIPEGQNEQSEKRDELEIPNPRPKRTIVKPVRFRDENFVQ